MASITQKFADYFVICGLDEISGLESIQDSSSGSQRGLLSPLKRRYKASVLCHYPKALEYNPFDANGVRMMCLPKGVRFLKNSFLEHKFHTFLLTREDGTRVYGSVLTYYERVRNDNILAAMQTLFAMYETEVDCQNKKKQKKEDRTTLDNANEVDLYNNALSNNTPNIKYDFPESSSNGTTSESSNTFNPEYDVLFVTKCICLIMQQPYVSAAKTTLKQLLSHAFDEANFDLPLESHIFSILYEVPAPPPGRTVRFNCGPASITTQNPTSSELPLFDYSLKEFFGALGVENVVDLFTCMLLEHQVLLMSSDLHKLMLAAEALTAFAFPLLWQHVYVPILPANLLHFLDAPVPFIMGLFYETEDEKDNFDIPLEGSLCLLDIDSNMVELPEEIPDLPHRGELINELNAMCAKFGVEVPKGSIWLRQGTLTPKGKEGDLERSSSNENLESDLEASFDKADANVSTPRKSSLVPYRGRSDSPSYTNSLGRNTRRSSSLGRRSKSKSPISSRKYGNDIIDKMKPRKISTPQGSLSAKPLDFEIAERSVSKLDKTLFSRPDSALASVQHLDVNSPDGNDKTKLSPNNSPKVPRASPDAVTMGNPRLAAMVAIAEKAGLDPNLILKKKHVVCSGKDVDLNRENLFVFGERALHISRKQQHENEFNIAVREIFVNRFTQMLVDYESFVILPKQNKADWLSNREHMHNFDKAAFLSDQSAMSLPFLTLFVETQGFASLIDMKVMTLWENSDPRLAYFDKRIDRLKVRLGIIRATVYEKCTTVATAIDGYIKRCNQIDHTAVAPHPLKPDITRERASGYFPSLQGDVLLASPNSSRKSGRINWRKRDKKQQHNQHLLLNSAIKANQEEGQKVRKKLAERVKQYMQESQALFTEGSLGDNQRTLSAFACRLLKECKIKTKRLVVLKLGQEAIELGHGEQHSAGIEENTLIASLCDLLERVWSHGVQLRQLEIGDKGPAKSRFVLRMRQSKSALWSHLVAFQKREELLLAAEYGIPEDENVEEEMKKLIQEATKSKKGGSMEILAEFGRGLRRGSPEPEALTNSLTRRRRSGSIDLPTELKTNLDSPKISLSNLLAHNSGCGTMETIRSPKLLARVGFLCDLKMVQGMKEIKTDTGYARAWTRLALEKKVLADQLKQLLGDRELLETRYKDYAFIRTDEEMEQFLFHLLSLNAVEFFCFTNGFVGTKINYKVNIVIGKHIAASTTANRWMMVSGSFGDTGMINIPKGEREFRFQHTNRGILTTLRVGHDNSGISPGWFIEHITITNEVTGQIYRFPCGRWLSRNQDDGSTERLLVAEMWTGLPIMQETGPKSPSVYETSPVSTLIKTTPTHKKISTTSRKGLTVSEIQERLADAVNSLVKFFFKEKEESLTYLLCAEGGFCPSMELVFQYGFKSSRLFGKNMFVWDYIEKVQQEYTNDGSTDITDKMTDLKRSKRCFCACVQRVNTSSQSIGKDERFQVWLCLGLRDHMLQDWFYLLSKSQVSNQMYETRSFILDENLLTFLIEVLDALTEFNISLDASITRGVL